MAFSGSDKYAPLIAEWNQAMVEYVPTWSKLANIRTDNAFSIRNYADITPGNLASWNGSASITEATKSYGSSHEQTVEADGFGRAVSVLRRDAGLDSGLVDRTAEGLLKAAQRTIEQEFYTALHGLLTQNVDNGGGGTTYALDGTFTLQDGSTQSNSYAVALSAAGLAGAREIMLKWKDYNGAPIGLGNGPLALVVSPKNADIAMQVTKSPVARETFTSTVTAAAGELMNPQATRPYDVIVSPYLTTDDDDWFLIETGAQTPLVVWQAQAPHLVIDENPLTQKVEMAVSMYLKVYCQTPPAGIIGANVA